MYQNTIKYFERISTNLSPKRLVDVAQAILDKGVKWDSSKDSMMAEYFGTEFEYDGARYKYEEVSEAPSSLNLVFGATDYVQTLIDEREADLAVELGKRNYKNAEKINNKVDNLKKLLAEVTIN